MNEKYKVKFERELWNLTGKIPMKDFCIRKAQDLVLGENLKLMVMFDSEMIELAVVDKLRKYWNKHRNLQPNHRWNCIEGELKSEWFYKYSGHFIEEPDHPRYAKTEPVLVEDSGLDPDGEWDHIKDSLAE